MEQNSKEKTQLLYVYPCHKGGVQPHHAAVSGFANTIRLENPKFLYKTVEIQNS